MASKRGNKNFDAAARAPYAKRFGLMRTIEGLDTAFDNNYAQKWSNAADTADVEGIRVGTDDKIMLGGGHVVQPCFRPIPLRMAVNADVATKCFHVFNYAARIISIVESHGTAGNDAGAVTFQITKDGSGVAPGSGIALNTALSLKATANTTQTATLASEPATLEVAAGDRLSFKLTGTATACANVCIVVWVMYYQNVFETSIHVASGNADQAFFIANRPYTLLAARFAAATAETTTTSLKLQLTLDTSTNAPGAGTDLLSNNSNGGFSCTATANVPQTGSLNATGSAAYALAAGDRLSIDYSGSATELAGIVVTVAFAAQPERIEVTFFDIDTDVSECAGLVADREYEFIEARQVHATAAGGTATAQLEYATGTTAPGSGTAIMASTFDLNGTANTVQIGAPSTVLSDRILRTGARLSLDYNHTEQSLAGLVWTASLKAI